MAASRTVTKEEILGAIEAMCAVVDVIKAHGEMGMPSGHLYAMIMGYFQF